jgi:hypothetical protein
VRPDSDNAKRTLIPMNDGVQSPGDADKEKVSRTMEESLGQWVVVRVEGMMAMVHIVSGHWVKTRETMRARTCYTSFEHTLYTKNHGER